MNIQPLKELQIDQLPISIFRNNHELGQAAANEAVTFIQEVIRVRGEANIILATGNSQLTFLTAFRTAEVDWPKVNIFHLDQYIGIDPNHPASFPLFLQKIIISYIKPKAFYSLSTQGNDMQLICKEYEALLRKYPADLCALGIGENGHLAFNDPPYADFNDPVWVKVVKLDEASRRQQVGEGHFACIEEVPTYSITLTIPALLAAKRVLAIVPEARKAEAILQCMTGPISTSSPASILRLKPYAHLYLDVDSAAKLINSN